MKKKRDIKKAIGYIIPHTHWDREWRYPIWKTRILLIEFFKELLDILESDPDYHCFLFDGQCVQIDDYLEAVPKDRKRVMQFIKEGRIAIGPWYTLPDLYPIDGECLVRNLLKGMRVSAEYGQTLKIAYMTFGWGQTAQLPQIYDQFGFDFIICAKNVSKKRAPYAEFLWESPDGTQVLTSRLGDLARSNFWYHAYIPNRYGVEHLSNSFLYSPEITGVAAHNADVKQKDTDFFLIDPKKGFHIDKLKKGIETSWKGTDNTLVPDHRLLLSGCDFTNAQRDITKIIDEANKMFDNKEFVNVRLEEYAEQLKKNICRDKLPIIKGELRDGPPGKLSGNALTSRIYLKQLNKKVQNLLLKQTEPIMSLLAFQGIEYDDVLLEKAWDYMLKSHPHDSINGATQDKTSDDIEYRLNQALEISEVLLERSINEMIMQINFSEYIEEDICLVVFNTLPQTNTEVIKVNIALPQIYDFAWDFDVVDNNGNIVQIQNLSRKEVTYPVHDPHGRPWPYPADQHLFYMKCDDIPAYGYTSYKVVPRRKFKRDHYYWKPPMLSNGKEIATSSTTLENEFLIVDFNSDGTFNMSDKRNGRKFEKMHYFEDSGDIGNYWVYEPPYENQVHTSQGSTTRIWVECSGHLSGTIVVEKIMTIPAYAMEPDYGIKGESKRSSETVKNKITSSITLKAGSERVDIKTKVDNKACQHRLRIAFPTGVQADHAVSSGHFTVDKRPRVPKREYNGKEYYKEMQTLPMQSFVDVSDSKSGVAFLSNAVAEYEYADDPLKTVFLTLFRSVDNMIVTSWTAVPRFSQQKGSNLLHEMEFEYSVYPHSGNWDDANVYTQADKLNTKLYPVQTSAHDKGHLPLKNGMLTIEPKNLILSAFKKSEDRNSYIIRMFNPTDKTLSGTISFNVPVDPVYLVDLKEARLKRISISNNIIKTKVDPHKIVSFEILPKEGEQEAQ